MIIFLFIINFRFLYLFNLYFYFIFKFYNLIDFNGSSVRIVTSLSLFFFGFANELEFVDCAMLTRRSRLKLEGRSRCGLACRWRFFQLKEVIDT